MKANAFVLSPEADVVLDARRFVATSTEPWLEIGPHPVLRPGDIVEIVYAMSLWDEPVRPVFRFWVSDLEWHDRIGPGPVAGAAIWTVRIPAGTVRISVSPTNRRGRFDFEIVAIRKMSFVALLAKGAWRQRRAATSTILTRLIGWKGESDVNLDWATGFTPLELYEDWRAPRTREIELDSIDAPRSDWKTGASIQFVVDAETAGPDDLARMVEALRAQPYPRWRLELVTDRERGDFGLDPRVGRLTRAEAAAFLRSRPNDSIIAVVAAGDALYSYALGAIAEAAARLPEIRVFYGDEDYRGDDQKLVPVLKPGWSPVLEARRPYLGRAVFLRAEVLGDWTDADCGAFLTRAEVPPVAAARFAAEEVHCLRRVILTRARPWPRSVPPPSGPGPAKLGHAGKPSALIIIPTRDRALLLSRCIESVFAKTEFDNFSVVIVDNDSVEPATHRLFAAFRGDKTVTVLRAPGPFNFSALCNAAAARRKADVLVFLNNDTEILSDDWLDRLVETAVLPDVGAVGGLLLYPDRRIQHAGVVLGMGNGAGHFGARARDGSPGWLARNEVAHEVSAVTGACLAVQRRKFMLVGGFDAEHLPVEQSDIDLCLRLAERGWRARFDPNVRLVHAESASRGAATFRRLHVYAEQRRWLHERWLGALRDDPYFHPGLSLYCLEAALS